MFGFGKKKDVSHLGRNALSNQIRSNDSKFQQDHARSNRIRADVPEPENTALWVKPLTAFIIGSVVAFLLLNFLFAVLFSAISNGGSDSIFVIMFGLKPITFWQTFILGATTIWVYLLAFAAGGALAWLLAYTARHERIATDHSDINSYTDDRHVDTLQELAMKYAIFPDAGAHSRSISPTAIIAHVTFTNNRRFKDVTIYQRNPDGSYITDDKGQIKTTTRPLIDEDLGHGIFESVGVKRKKDHIMIDPFKLNYSENYAKVLPVFHWRTPSLWKTDLKERLKVLRYNAKLKPYTTVGEFIQKDWYMPKYETQQPAGAFFVETNAVNTFVVAITRGNKGQLWVNNTADVWSRQHEPQNMFFNDPKGEIYAAFHDLFELRGIEPVAFNLMDSVNSSQFNVLAPSILAARKGDVTSMQQALLAIMDSFFPIDSKGEPFWTQSQQTLVRMMIYVMIDYFVEEEREFIQQNANRDQSVINKSVDDMWSKVTMFNIYQMLTVLSREKVKINFDKVKDPTSGMDEDDEDLREHNVSPDLDSEEDEDGEEMNKLTAFFKATQVLPANSLRDTALQQNDAMIMMADSEKTRATIYGMTLVAMLFFTEGPIARLTSASPTQSFDPITLAFPRRIRIKLNSQYVRNRKLDTQNVNFEAYHDIDFKHKYDSDDFKHSTRIDELGWVEYVFKGIFDDVDVDEFGSKNYRPIYIKMLIRDKSSGLVMTTFYFEYTRGFMKTASGRDYVIDPKTHGRILKNGTVRVGHVETKIGSVRGEDGQPVKTSKFVVGQKRVVLPDDILPLDKSPKVFPIDQTEAIYTTRPKAVFSITPPHLASYIKIVLLIVSVIFSENVSQSYLTKETGKPFYMTRSMLDELGNMQVEGHGIDGFQTKLSIGLGQGQQYTMILQTIQQLKDVYGDSVDKIVSGNTGIFVYLLSNEVDMLEEISKQAGSTHVARATSKSITKKDSVWGQSIQDDVSYTIQTSEERLFSIDKLMSFTNGEALIITTNRANNSGGSERPAPVYDTDATLMPMAWRLHLQGSNSKMFKHALQNVPSLATTRGVNVYDNIPDFNAMYQKRLKQAKYVYSARTEYAALNNMSIENLINLDKNTLSDNLMLLINKKIRAAEEQAKRVSDFVTNDDARLVAAESTQEVEIDENYEYEDEPEPDEYYGNVDNLSVIEETDDYKNDLAMVQSGKKSLSDVPDHLRDSIQTALDTSGEEKVGVDENVLQSVYESKEFVEKQKALLYANESLSYQDLTTGTAFKDIVGKVLAQLNVTSRDHLNASSDYRVVQNHDTEFTFDFTLTWRDKPVASISWSQQQPDSWDVFDDFVDILADTKSSRAWRLDDHDQFESSVSAMFKDFKDGKDI